MRSSKTNTEMLTDYLLGRLSPVARERMERDYLADEELHEQLLAIESELLDSYVCGELNTDEGKYLIRNLSPDATKDRIAFARALALATHRMKSESSVTHIPRSRRSFNWKSLSLIPLRVQFAVACLMVVAIGGIVALKHWSQPPAKIATSSPPPAAQADHPTMVAALLFPVERSVGQQAPGSVTLPRESRSITLQLIISASEEYSAYTAKIDALNGPWSGTFPNLRTNQTAAGEKVLELILDSAQLNPGDYRISVSGVRGPANELVAGFFFRAKAQ